LAESPANDAAAEAAVSRGLPMPARPAWRGPLHVLGAAPAGPAVRRARLTLAALVGVLGGALLLAFWAGIDRGAASPAVVAVTAAMFALNALWLASGASVALLGLGVPRPGRAAPMARKGGGRCAVLGLVCGEPPGPLARRAVALRDDLCRAGIAARCDIFVLSDTRAPEARAAEARLFAGMPGIRYRNRTVNTGRKPGNVTDWIGSHGAGYETMLVLDADSRFSADRLAALLARMDAQPGIGLIQSGIRLRPGTSRLAGMLRLSSRLCGPGFVRGTARWTGTEGNYWGHNALIRTAAFAGAAGLPKLSGRAPWGGPVLSHDFVEAAWLRRAGWEVEIDPETRGSFEEAPETLAEFHRRDRRWCQGNLQHLRLLGAAGLHPVSRLHLLSGIQSYLSAPLWLGLLAVFASGALVPTPMALWSVAGVAAMLLLPKAAGLAEGMARLRGKPRARRVLLRAAGAELALSTAVAPVVMLRQTLAVVAVLAGRDSGWTPAGGARPASGLPAGSVEALAGLALFAAALSQGPSGVVLMPVALPLLAAPALIRWFDAPRPRRTARQASALATQEG